MRQHLVNHFLDRESLRASRRQECQPAHFVVEFFASSASAFQDDHDHGDAQSHSQKMVECDAQQEKRTKTPKGAIQAMQATQEEYSCEKLGAVPPARHFRSPHHPPSQQADHRLEDGGFPVQGTHLAWASPFDIVNGGQEQADHRNDGREALRSDLLLTLARYFLTGQASPYLDVPSHIMPRGGTPTWRWKTYWSWTMRKQFERSFRPCWSPRAIAARRSRTAASPRITSRKQPPTWF